MMNEKYNDNSTLTEYYKNGDRFQCGNEVWELFYKSDNGTRGKVKLVMRDGVEQDGTEKNTITFNVEWRANKPYVTQKIGTRQARQIVNENNMKTRKTNKKALYENIMKNVSRVVKKSLNENGLEVYEVYVQALVNFNKPVVVRANSYEEAFQIVSQRKDDFDELLRQIDAESIHTKMIIDDNTICDM